MKRNVKKIIALSLVSTLILSNTHISKNMALENSSESTTEATTNAEDINPDDVAGEYTTTFSFDENGEIITNDSNDEVEETETTTESTEASSEVSTEVSSDETTNEETTNTESSETSTEVTNESTETSTEVSNEDSTESTEDSTEEVTNKEDKKSNDKGLYIKLTEGGVVTVTITKDDSKIVNKLEVKDGKLESDNEDITVVEKVKDDFYKIYTSAEDADVKVETEAKTDYQISFYSKKIDNGKWEAVDLEDDYNTNNYTFSLDSDVYLNIGFEETINIEGLDTFKYNNTHYWFKNDKWSTFSSYSSAHGKKSNGKNFTIQDFAKACINAGINGSYTRTFKDEDDNEKTINYNKYKIADDIAALKAADKEDSITRTYNTSGKIISGTLSSKSTCTIEVTGNDFKGWKFSGLTCCSPRADDANKDEHANFDIVMKATSKLEKNGSENEYTCSIKIYFLNTNGAYAFVENGSPDTNENGVCGVQNSRIKTSVNKSEVAYGSIYIDANKSITGSNVSKYDYNLNGVTLKVDVSTIINSKTYSESKTFSFDECGWGYYYVNNEPEYVWEVTKISGQKIPKDNKVTVSWTEYYPDNIMSQVSMAANGTLGLSSITATATEDGEDETGKVANITIDVTNSENFGSAKMIKYYKNGDGTTTSVSKSSGIKYGLFVKNDIYEKLAMTPTIATYNNIQLKAGTRIAVVDPNTLVKNLPFGTYYFQELSRTGNVTDSIWGNDYYLRDSKQYEFTISGNKLYAEMSNLSSPETTPRGNFSFSKWANLNNKYQKPLADIPFLLTYIYPDNTQESTVVLTDNNGKFSSVNAKCYHSLKLKGSTPNNRITSADIAGAKQTGTSLKFGSNYGNISEGAVPIFRQPAKIIVKELWCDTNINMKNMITATITIGSDDAGNGNFNITPNTKTYAIPGSNWTDVSNASADAKKSFRNDVDLAQIKSTALSDATKSHILPISDITVGDNLGDGTTRITDTLLCTKLYSDHNYKLIAKLVEVGDYTDPKVNFEDVQAYVDSSGNKLECTVEFNSASGTLSDNGVSYTVPMNYIINSTDVAGKTFVALVQLYDLTLQAEYNEVFLMAEEVNLDTKDQQLYSLAIETDAYNIKSGNSMIYANEVSDDEITDDVISPKNAGILITEENEDFQNIKFGIADKITLHNFSVGNYYVVSELREYTTDTLISTIGTEETPQLLEVKDTNLTEGFVTVSHENVIIPKVDTRQGLRLYVTEKIYVKNPDTGKFVKIAQHVDKEDPRQTVYFTGLDSVFDTSYHQSPVTVQGETTTLVDNVILRNLVLGQTYTVINYMRDNTPTNEEVTDESTVQTTTNEVNQLGADESTNTDNTKNTDSNDSNENDIYTDLPKDIMIINGEPIRKEITFTVDEEIHNQSLTAEGYVIPMSYTVDTSVLAGKSVTFGERLYIGSNKVNTHERLNDKNEQTRFPVIGTTAKDIQTLTQMVTVGETTIVDTVKIENLQANTKQKLKGILMDKATGEYLGKDLGLEPITGEVEWTTKEDDSERNMEVEVKFTIPNSIVYAGKQAVVFEELYTEDTLTAFHKDINDLGQTVTFVEAKTTAYGDDDSKYVYPDDAMHVIRDIVHYKGLEVGKTYTQTGALWTTNEKGEEIPLLIDGVQPTTSVEFTPTTSEGDITIEFTIPTKYLSGAKIVVFEDTYYNGIKVATHADINDDNQTLYVPKTLQIAVAKADKDDIKYFLKGAEITIYDQNNNVALDVNGEECIGVTDKDGLVKFSVYCKEGESFYAKETKAPNGYRISEEIYEVVPTDKLDDINRNIIKINILDEAIVIPPITGDTLLIFGFIVLAILGCAGIAFVVVRKRKSNN